jgi:predicted TIM-barrel fold metal-dependent hydrolase
MREHMRLSIQPLDAPLDAKSLLQVVDQLGSENMLMYASDYPHRHASEPEATLLRHLTPSLAQKIRSDNARDWYRL